MDGKTSKSFMSLRTQQTLLYDRCTCLKKKRNAKAVKVAAVLKCQIGLRRATWSWILKQWFSLVLPLEFALLLHTKIGQDPRLISEDEIVGYLHVCTNSMRWLAQLQYGKAGAVTVGRT